MARSYESANSLVSKLLKTAKQENEEIAQSQNPKGHRKQAQLDLPFFYSAQAQKKVAGGCGSQPLVRLACASPPLERKPIRKRAQARMPAPLTP
jgi:hypothetical protein